MDVQAETGKRILGREINRKALFIILLVCLAILLAPMLYIARYDVPSADDYFNGIRTHNEYVKTGSMAGVLSEAVEKTIYTYETWQGTFTGVFLMTLQPGIYGEQYYGVTVVIMLAALLGSIFFFCYTLFGHCFGADKYSCGIIAAVLSVIATQFVPVPAEAFYWYTGAVFYTLFFSASLVVYALILRYIRTDKKYPVGLFIAISLLLLFISGGNYITALVTAELLALAVITLLIFKNKRWRSVFFFLLLFMAGFLVSVICPGNAVRQAMYQERLGLVGTIIQCFKAVIEYSAKYTTLPVAALMTFLIPVFGGLALKTEYRFPYPVVFTLISICLFASSFCPPFYATGLILPGRLKDVIYFIYVMLGALNVFYWTGWLLRRYEKLERPLKGIKLWFTLAMALLFAVGTGLVVRQQNVTSAYAAIALLNGGAKSYYDTAVERRTQLFDENVVDLAFEPFEYTPSVLFFSDVSDDPQEARNLAMCEYFGKNSIYLTAPYDDYWD